MDNICHHAVYMTRLTLWPLLTKHPLIDPPPCKKRQLCFSGALLRNKAIMCEGQVRRESLPGGEIFKGITFLHHFEVLMEGLVLDA